MTRTEDDSETVDDVPVVTGANDQTRVGLGLIVLYGLDDTEHIGGWISAKAARGSQAGVIGRGPAVYWIATGDDGQSNGSVMRAAILR